MSRYLFTNVWLSAKRQLVICNQAAKNLIFNAYLEAFFSSLIKNPSTFQLAFLRFSAGFSYGLKGEQGILTLLFEGCESKTPQMLKFRSGQRARESIICNQLGLRLEISKSQRLESAKMADVTVLF